MTTWGPYAPKLPSGAAHSGEALVRKHEGREAKLTKLHGTAGNDAKPVEARTSRARSLRHLHLPLYRHRQAGGLTDRCLPASEELQRAGFWASMLLVAAVVGSRASHRWVADLIGGFCSGPSFFCDIFVRRLDEIPSRVKKRVSVLAWAPRGADVKLSRPIRRRDGLGVTANLHESERGISATSPRGDLGAGACRCLALIPDSGEPI
jgi:hypothetical protein